MNIYDTVDCPYCGYENDMSHALTDGLSDDNKLDWECQKCDEEFEVTVEFEPSYSADKIVYHECDKCGTKTRNIYKRGMVFPFPESLEGKSFCKSCWAEAYLKECEKGSNIKL
ncbi:hypothetical protein [Paenibacillus donghaensis]|uniref:Uncharacterized protein n=1 Tax=Paenibacillus donghaensis TaxID=414771 RepID=A0A2Z2KAH1_9BACL|nr:hypothetical protein [Paenibacillus donghaensis]ASA22594.1 hypothetical protein B9T62_18480 [Paenibacillus donghaensis]